MVIPTEAANDVEQQLALEVLGLVDGQPCLLDHLKGMAKACLEHGDSKYQKLPHRVCFPESDFHVKLRRRA